MGWDEVKKINSDMKVPLDVYQYLNDYRLWGEDSYVYQDKSKLHKLYETTVVSMNDLELSGEALEYFIENNKHIGKALSNAYGIDAKETLVTLSTMTAVLNSSVAMAVIANSSAAMSAVLNSPTAMAAVLNSPTALQAVVNSSTAMQAVANSSTAMTAVLNSPTALSSICKANYNTTKAFIIAVNNNADYIKKIMKVVTTNGAKFQYIISKYENAVWRLNEHCKTPDSIVLCALGYNEDNSSASVNLFIDNEKIKTSNSAGRNPQSVNEYTCNAIAVPVATFTKNGAGYAAVLVYKAI